MRCIKDTENHCPLWCPNYSFLTLWLTEAAELLGTNTEVLEQRIAVTPTEELKTQMPTIFNNPDLQSECILE